MKTIDYTSTKEYNRLIEILGGDKFSSVDNGLDAVTTATDCVLSIYGMNKESYDNLCYYFEGVTYEQLVKETDK